MVNNVIVCCCYSDDRRPSTSARAVEVFNLSAAPISSEPCVVNLHLDTYIGSVPSDWSVTVSVCVSLSVCLFVCLSHCD